MRVVSLLCLLACGSPEPVPEPTVEEPRVVLPCFGQIRAHMAPEELETICGPATSRVVMPAFPDALALRWCGTERCAEMWAAAFWHGELMAWGRAYEVHGQ